MLNMFKNVLVDKLQEYNLEKHIGDGKIEIDIMKLPNHFKYTNNGSIVYMVFAYSYHFQEMLYRENETFELKYTFTDNYGNKRSDTINYVFPQAYQGAGLSAYKFVEDYLIGLKSDFEVKSEDFIYQIIESL